MRESRACAAVIMLLLCSACAGAIGKVTVDPNTPDKVVRPDTRVEQKVTYTARRLFVWRILAEISAQTGVTLNAGFNDQDWQVRDRRMTILVSDVPLKGLMDSISRTMKFAWKPEGDQSTPSYRLYMDRRAVLLYEAERRRAADRIASLRARCRRNLLNSISEGADMSDQEIADLKESNPYGYALARSGAAAGLSELFETCPEARAAIEDGHLEWFGNSSDMSDGARQAASRALGGLSSMDMGGMNPAYASSVPQGVSGISINNTIDDKGESIVQLGITYYIGKDGEECRFFYLRDPASERAAVEGERTAALWDAKPRDYYDINQGFDQRMQSARVPDWANSTDDSREPLAKHQWDPDLEKPIDLTLKKDKEYTYEDLEDLIAEKCGLNIVAEDYVGEFSTGSFGELKVETAAELLGILEDATESNWWKHGSVVEVRSRHWYEARQWQIPEAWLETWRQTFKTTGTLDIDDLVSMASLTWDQILDNVLVDPVLNCGQGRKSGLAAIMHQSDVIDSLGIYGRLTRRQKEFVFSKRGLDLLSIPNRKEVLGEADAWVSEAKRLVVTGTKQPKGKAWEYRFDIDLSIDDREPNLPLLITTPAYVSATGDTSH